MTDEKKYKVGDLAEEIAVSPSELLEFLKEKGIKVASISSRVGEEVRAIVVGNYSAEKKQSEAQRKHKEDKTRKLKELEKRSQPAPSAADERPKTKEKSRAVVKKAEEQTVTAIPPAALAEPPVAEKVADAAPEIISVQPVEPVAETPSRPVEATPEPVNEKAVEPEPQPTEPTQPTETIAESASEPTVLETQTAAPVASEVAEPETSEPAESIEADAPDETTAEESEDAPDSRTGMQLSVERDQAEINTKFTQSENVGGLKVFGAIDLQKKKRKRKKSFKEQMDDLKVQQTAAAAATAAAPKPAAPKTDAKPTDAKPPVTAKKTAREEQIEKAQASVNAGKKKGKKFEVDAKAIDRNIRQTMLDMGESSEANTRQKFRKIRRREREEAERIEEARVLAEQHIVRLTEYASTHEFADLIGVTPKEVIEKCFKLGKFITINQRLDRETLELLALEFGKEIQFVSEVEATMVDDDDDAPEDMTARPPVVTIMGHVDHGKTSLLDYIRRSNVVAGESGGITQHIGAYEVELENKRKLTFLDTPGHEAFTAMRARGAQVTDIVILVVAADDSVMPQTKEAINHAKAANVPIVVAINKIDKPDANPDKIRTQLSENGVTVEEWGGDTQSQEISAKKGDGVRELLEKVLTQADIMELKANHNPKRHAKGVVIEAELDKGKGVVATVMVQQGILKVGDPFVAGVSSGRVRAMLNERSNREELANPSQPVRVLGFEHLPQSGDIFSVVETDREAREISQKRQVIKREQEFRQRHHVTLNEVSRQIQQGNFKELRVIVKADVDGSVEALADGLMKTQANEVKVRVIHRGVGQITESDVLLAAASEAIIIGFRVRPNLNAKRAAEKEEIDVRFYTVIYHALEDVKDALEGMLAPEMREEITSTVEVRKVYKISKIGTVAGCYVLEGKITRDARVRLLRDGIQVFDGELDSLKRVKDDVKEVETGFECGIAFKNFNDVKEGDMIESYHTVETKRKLVMS